MILRQLLLLIKTFQFLDKFIWYLNFVLWLNLVWILIWFDGLLSNDLLTNHRYRTTTRNILTTAKLLGLVQVCKYYIYYTPITANTGQTALYDTCASINALFSVQKLFLFTIFIWNNLSNNNVSMICNI